MRIDGIKVDAHKLTIEYLITNYGPTTEFVLADDNYYSVTADENALYIRVGAKLDPNLVSANKFVLPKLVTLKPLMATHGKLDIDLEGSGIENSIGSKCVQLFVLRLAQLPMQNIDSIAQYNGFVDLHGRWLEANSCE